MRILAVTNIYPTPQAPSSGTFVKQQIEGLRRVGVDVDVMLIDRAAEGMQAYAGVGRQVRKRTALGGPDIVHVMYGGVLADEVTRASTEPVVVSFCGSDLLGQRLSGPVRRVISAYGVLASHRAARRAAAVVVKSRNLEQSLPRDVDRSKVRIIPNGVDLGLFRPLDQQTCRRRLGWHDDRLNVLFPTNCGDGVKRLPLALAAVALAQRNGVPAELHELRNVVHSEVPIWINASDVVMLTSLHEGSPNIVKEALACNVAVVSVDVGDVAERLTGIEGCHVASPDPVDLAAALSRVYSVRRRVAGRARISGLSVDSIAVQLKELYEELVRTSPLSVIAPPRGDWTEA